VFADDGYEGRFETILTPIRDLAGKTTGLLGVARDITDRKRAAQEIERLAFYDALTSLPNRRLLLDRLQRLLLSGQRTRQHGALLFIDLDNFKDLNDTLGHDMGDQLLIQVATRLSASVRECDTVARFGGDEFVVLLEGLDQDAQAASRQAEAVARKLLMALNQPFELAGQQHYSTPSIGLTLFGPERQSVDELLKRADLAMYEAKAAGRNTHRFFDPGMQQALHERSSLEADLRQGLARAATSTCTTNPSWTTKATSKAQKPWPAGTTPNAASSTPPNSSPWPNKPASSCPWAGTSCTPRANNSYAGAANRKPPT
jgi:diguanylate cyclase (GGDEF)-like protein